MMLGRSTRLNIRVDAPSNDLPAVDVRDLYRFYRAGEEETLALRGVSIECAAGEITVVSGPSGSGKSTLLACMTGLDDPSGGTVRIAGHRISHLPEPARSLLRARFIGVMRQTGNLVDHLNVVDNVRLAASLGPREHRSQVDAIEILARVGLERRASVWPQQLSGGEASRAALAIALAHSPAILVADEPTGELDSFSEAQVLQLFRVLARQGMAVVVASHSLAVAAEADVMVELADGARR